ncbi:MAG: hypothetical protein RIT28_3741 [Pseudomonadota bacterium]
MTRALLLLLFTFGACKPKPPEVAAEPAEIAAPFDAAELRAGLPEGTTVLYRITTPDGATMYTLWEVVQAGEGGLVVHQTLVGEDRAALGPAVVSAKTWEGLQAESLPGGEIEALEPTKQPMALGTLRVSGFIVTNPDNDAAFDIITFSERHPGPAIKLESRLNGEMMLTVEAIEWTVGPPP